ncbi:MAG: B12-binding domain-containing radical SAM protein [bacterium]|nr:B12-binding domain-containing radical SAM protein [bacterium]
MKIALVIPMNRSDNGKSFYDYTFYSKFLLSRRYISYLLAIPTLVSLTPPEHEIRIFDENIEDIDYSWEADLVGISVRTMFAKRAYGISEAYREKGVKTVLGGIHPSMCPDETLEHCDSVVIGEAEGVWGTLLQDAAKDQLQQRYHASTHSDLKSSPAPDRSLLSKEKYLSDVVQTAKGCPFNCEFCSVHAFDGRSIRTKTVKQVLREIQEINRTGSTYKKKNAVFFVDDNIIADKRFARELFVALKEQNLNWMCQASINIFQEDELLSLMRASGCGAIFIGFESISKDNLARMHKGVNQHYDYLRAIRAIQSHGLLVHSSFIIGYDFDTQETIDELGDFIQESQLLMPLINLLTPLPGTELFKRFDREGRILHKDWSLYDTKHVVFTPAQMLPEELSAGYERLLKRVYSFDSIWEKLNYYWDIDFWKRSNELDPVKFRYRFIFALRLCSLLFTRNTERSKFIVHILPRVFDKRVRISTILTLMAYNDFAYTI